VVEVGVGAGVGVGVVGMAVQENGPGKIEIKQVVETTIGRGDMTRRWLGLVQGHLLSFFFLHDSKDGIGIVIQFRLRY